MTSKTHRRLSTQPLWIVLSTMFFGTAVMAAGRPGTSRETGQTSLRVTSVSPIGEVRKVNSIDLVFDAEMVATDRRGKTDSRPPLEFEPEIDGDFFWIGSRAISFFPREEIIPGTVLACRVRKGTRSLAGNELSGDYAWKITVGRPELLGTFPVDGGRVASNGVLYLQFSLPPAEGAERFVHLIGPKGEIPCARIPVDPKTVPVGMGATGRGGEPVVLLPLKPEAMAPRTRYKLSIDPEMPFIASDVGLLAERTLRFRTWGEPKLLTVTGYGEGLLLEFAAPIDRETLRAHFSIDPPAPRLSLAPDSGSTFLLSGEFVRGRSYTFRIREGLVSLHGERLSSDQIRNVSVSHAAPGLDVTPKQGYIPRGPGGIVRLAATNIDSVEIFGAWLDPDSVSSRLFRTSPLLTEDLPKIGTWAEPGLHPDSTHRLDLPLTVLGRPPREGRVAAIRARGNLLDRTAQEVPGRLTHALLQVSDLSLSIHVGNEGGIAWVTRLSSGKPLDQGEIRLFVRAKVQPVWQGVTDENGLIRLPGWNDLGLPPRSAIVVQARTNDDAVWARVRRPDLSRALADAGSDSLRLRGDLWTDRSACRPGETVHWVAIARRVGRGIITPAGIESLGYRIERKDRDDLLGQGSLEVDPAGNAKGWFTIPLQATAARYDLILTDGPDGEGTAIASRSFDLIEPLPRPYETEFDLQPPSAVFGSSVELSASFRHPSGRPVAYAPIRWKLLRRPDRSRTEPFEDYSFGDARSPDGARATESALGIEVAEGSDRLDAHGRTVLRRVPSIEELHEDQIYTLLIERSGPTGDPIAHTFSFPVRRASFRAGVRARVAPGSGVRAIEFAAIAIGAADQAIDNVELRWSIAEVPSDSILETGSWTTATEPPTMRWMPPGPGTYAISVEGTDALGRTTGAQDVIEITGFERGESAGPTAGRQLILEPENNVHSSGDTARVRVKTPSMPTEGLVLFLDDGIRKVQRLPNVRGAPRMLVPLEGFGAPGTWMRTILVGRTINPHDVDTMWNLPHYSSGQIFLPIRDERRRLRVEIETDLDEIARGEELLTRIRLQDHTGLAVSGTATIALVPVNVGTDVSLWRPDPLSTLLPVRADGTASIDTRSRLHFPTPRDDGNRIAEPTEEETSTPAAKNEPIRSVLWEPLIEIGPEGEAVVPIRFDARSNAVRICVLGTSGAERFGYAEAEIPVREGFRLDWEAPAFIRATDEFEVAASVGADTTKAVRVTIEAEVVGAVVDGNTKRKLKLNPNERERVPFRLKEPDRAGVSLRIEAAGLGRIDTASIAIPVEHALVWTRSFTSGRAAPHFRTTVQSGPDPLPDLGGLTTVISPSILSGLDDAVASVLRTRGQNLGQLSNRLLAHCASARRQDYLGIADQTRTTNRDETISKLLQRIARCVADDEAYGWPTPHSPEARDYQVGYALYSLASALEQGVSVPIGLIGRLDRIAEQRLLGLREAQSPELARKQILDRAPWLIWARIHAGRHIASGADSGMIRDVEELYLMRKEAPVESKIVLGLAVETILEGPKTSWVGQGWRNLLEVLIQEIKEGHTNRKGRRVWVSASEDGWGDGTAGDERATALLLLLLAKQDPWNEILPGMIAWLLDERRSDSGSWANAHATALVVDLLVSTVVDLEGPRTQVSGKLGIGTEFEDFLFRPSGAVQTRRETPMADLLSADGEPVFMQVRVDTDGRRSIYVTSTLEEARSALAVPPHESGLSIDRQYLSSDGDKIIETCTVGEPVLVRLSIALPKDVRALVVEDPLPAGFTVPSLQFRTSPAERSARSGSNRAEHRLRIVHRERTDRLVRFHAEELPAGIHHFYYTAIPATVGRFWAPGARAERMYDQATYGTSAPRQIRIKSER